MQRGYSRTKLVTYIVNALEDGADTNALAQEVAAYLMDAGKVSDLGSVLRDAQEKRAQQYGTVEFTAASAHELDQAQKDQIERVALKQYVGAKKVTMHYVRDESVVGGTNLTFPQTSLDVTIRNKLNGLRKGLIE